MFSLLLTLAACDPIGSLTRASLAPDPTARLQVRLFRHTEGGWHPDAEPIAHAFSSLHALAWGDELVVPGLPSAHPPSWLDEQLPHLAVGALVTRDLRTWTARSWPVDAPGKSLIDPALVQGPDGVELWFVQVEGGGDPARGGRGSTIVRTRWDGARFGAAEVWASGTGLVDPSPVWFDGGWRVFATRDHAAVVVIDAAGQAPREVLRGATVPFARVDDDGAVVLLAQRADAGRMVPVSLRSVDTRAWSAPVPVLDPSVFAAAGLRTCSSPVEARLGGEEVLLCVDERP